MAGFSHDITSTRTTPVDQPALLATLRASDPTAGFSTLDSRLFKVKKGSAWTAQQITQVQNAIDNAPDLTPQRAAQNLIDGWDIAQKSLVLALIDQVNLIRSKLSPPLGAITPAQALAAIRDKAGTL